MPSAGPEPMLKGECHCVGVIDVYVLVNLNVDEAPITSLKSVFYSLSSTISLKLQGFSPICKPFSGMKYPRMILMNVEEHFVFFVISSLFNGFCLKNF